MDLIMEKINVIRSEPGRPETSKELFSSRSIFESETDRITQIRLAGGFVGGWHHHGKRQMYGYVISGKAAIEFGKNGEEVASFSQGDFFVIPPGLVHRDVNPNKDDVIIAIFNVGAGPTSVQVSGPD
jgi:mannose-6-phosphate isomerase-like protein (cupin superfamily)